MRQVQAVEVEAIMADEMWSFVNRNKNTVIPTELRGWRLLDRRESISIQWTDSSVLGWANIPMNS